VLDLLLGGFRLMLSARPAGFAFNHGRLTGDGADTARECNQRKAITQPLSRHATARDEEQLRRVTVLLLDEPGCGRAPLRFHNGGATPAPIGAPRIS
jgi:hypothetical protein